MVSLNKRNRKASRSVPGNGEEARPVDNGLADTQLTPEAFAGAQAVNLALIDRLARRAAAAFLGREDYRRQQISGGLTMHLMLEALPRFVHELGGQIALASRIDQDGEIGDPVTHAVEVDGESRQILLHGCLFLHFPGERIVLNTELSDRPMEPVQVTEVRTASDPAEFIKRWEDYSRKHNYLRGRAFFADGDLIKTTRSYGWSDIVLSREAKEAIDLHVLGFLQNRDRLRKLGLKHHRGLILSGPPGTGKTLIGKVLASTQKGTSFIWVSPRHIRCPSSFESILSVARYVSPAIVFFEDIDVYAEDREFHGGTVLGELMNQLDGAIDNEDVLAIATTNRLEVVEKALRNRPGRFDRVVRIAEMDEDCRRRLLSKVFDRVEVNTDDMEYLVRQTKDFTGSQIEELANTVHLLGVTRSNEASREEIANTDDRLPADRQLLDSALRDLRVERRSRMGFHPD